MLGILNLTCGRLPFSYVFKRLIRSWQLYTALFLGTTLASTFFAGINIGADTAARQVLDKSLSETPVDFYASSYQRLSSLSTSTIVNQLHEVEGVTNAEAITRAYVKAILPDNKTYNVRLIGISEDSEVFEGWTDRPVRIEENTTQVLVGSLDAQLFKQGEIIRVSMSAGTGPKYFLNLSIAGLAQLDQRASSILQGNYQYSGGLINPGVPSQSQKPAASYESVLVVSLERTLTKFIDLFYRTSGASFYTDFLVYIDRSSVINIWDLPGSLQKLDTLRRRIENQIRTSGSSLSVYNTLESRLSLFQYNLSIMRLSFFVVSLPVFFVAWYMGTTVSDVSFSMRRREIGLMQVKGFSKRQLFIMFLSEAMLIGIAAGALGIVFGIALDPLFVAAIGGSFSGLPQVAVDTVILTTGFSLVLTILAVFRPARRASNLQAVDALRKYMYEEEAKSYRKRWPWFSFALGSYKMIIFALGINMISEATKFATAQRNFAVVLLAWAWAVFDVYVLTYIGPVLFFWGFTKIFIRGSLKFQEITVRAARFLGDLGTLATRNVQRNPVRAASVAFLVAMIVGYSVQVTGVSVSDRDYDIRTASAYVGADVSVELGSWTNISDTNEIMNIIRSNISGVASTAAEYSFSGTTGYGSIQIKAVDPKAWSNVAFYEDHWFTGNAANVAFQHLSSNSSIILERAFAERNALNLNDKIMTYTFAGALRELTIVGFFGAQQSKTPSLLGLPRYDSFWSWSYVSEGFFRQVAVSGSYSTKILVKLKSGADERTVANQIRTLLPSTRTVYSVSEQLQQPGNLLSTGTVSFQRLGVVFAVLGASIGTALVTFVSMKERQREASVMSVRGLSFKQLTIVLLTENLAVVVFAILLGTAAGLIIVYGNATSFNSTFSSLVAKRVVFPVDALLSILAYFGLVLASTVLPVVLMTKKYISRLDKVVRQV